VHATDEPISALRRHAVQAFTAVAVAPGDGPGCCDAGTPGA
jgi:hypothetical protein